MDLRDLQRSGDVLEALARYDTPTICNALEVVLPDGSLEDYRNVVQRTFGAKYTPDDVYAGDLFSALGAIDSGVEADLPSAVASWVIGRWYR